MPKTGIMASDVMLKDTKKNITRYFNQVWSNGNRLENIFFPDRKCFYFNSCAKIGQRRCNGAIGFQENKWKDTIIF